MEEIIQSLEDELGSGVYKVVSPLYVTVGKKKPKKQYLNLNSYRNFHHQHSNNVKKAYTELMLPMVQELPSLQKVAIIYVIYPRTKAEMDVANVGSIVDKFFSDTIVQANKLTDDNFKFLPMVTYMYGGLSKDNPRVDIYVIDQIKKGKQ